MGSKVSLKAIYAPSEDVVAREVQSEFIIIPISSLSENLPPAAIIISATASITAG
jgi:hypothetical protein